MKIITNIAITEDTVILDYFVDSDHPILTGGQMVIPLEFAQEHDQLWADLNELIQDAEVLLDSAQATYHKSGPRMKEMGRT